ncbi:MAG: cadmium-translocating P-type ATPase [Proteobacteria bacterium]|nr:cadmium-translocating P-type ATPase [Pseudomonadota bacterium]
MHCASCVAIIEGALKKQPEIAQARLNLSTRRLSVSWKGAKDLGDKWISLIQSMGYRAAAFDPETSESQEKREEKGLLRCLAVAGFASGNLMLFSIPLWTSDSVEMGSATRSMFQWIQALIAIPAIAYCGQPFYRSAWRALKEWRTNMDVPISVAVLLATAMSLFETIRHGQHAYFDSAVMLLFFLLIGRYLESRARGLARSAAHDLLRMRSGTATTLLPDGRQQIIPMSEIVEGMTLLVAAGEKIGADGDILSGVSEIDTSLITGETLPQPVSSGTHVFAGTINLASPITLRVTGAGERSLLADIVRLMEAAEQSQARYVTLADKISSWYTPAVHALAAATFIGWVYFGAPWQVALLYAATVLVITCPCALGLAVPVVQVLASGMLMRRGILLKSGSALERLAEITHVVFDKTGTLTLGQPQLMPGSYTPTQLQYAASLAVHSRHPLSQALTRAYKGPLLSMDVKEVPGFGLEAEGIRLGRANWCGIDNATDSMPALWLAVKGEAPARFTFSDQLRSDAAQIVAGLRREGLPVTLLSGDRPEVVARVASEAGITQFMPNLSPVEKCAQLDTLKQQGIKLLMVGDGLNDAPALACAYASMSPASAMDITQNAADIVFQGDALAPVRVTLDTARFAQKLVKQNFLMAIAYNLVAIPLAVAGYVTPLVAAIAMSSSSLIVIANAMRLNLGQKVASS